MGRGTLLSGTAFVTGAASGIGKATTFALAEHGVYQFALGDIDVEMLHTVVAELKLRYPVVDVLELLLDVSSEQAVSDAVSKTVNKFGRLDIAVNNAGVAGPSVPTTEVTFDAWKSLFDINLHGVWLCERAEIRQMLKQDSKGFRTGRGVIINVASMLGVIGATSGVAAYPASKHAVIGLTRSDSNKFASEGIRINAICPGYIETPLVAKATNSGVMNVEIAKTPMKRLGTMEEIGDCIVFLASPMASFMTGAAMIVDGGFTAGSNYSPPE